MSISGVLIAFTTRVTSKITNLTLKPTSVRTMTQLTASTVNAASETNYPSTMSASSIQPVPFSVHSTFRDLFHQQLFPTGLEWDLAGTSHMSYAFMDPRNDDDAVFDLSADDAIRQGIVIAHNRWSFAKDLPFKQVQDIEGITLSSTGQHVFVQWKGNNLENPYGSNNPDGNVTVSKFQDIPTLLQSDDAALGKSPPMPVWINGKYVTDLQPSTINYILSEIEKVPSLRLSWKKTIHNASNITSSGSTDASNKAKPATSDLRIERYFTGGLRKRQDIFEHIMDNLYALEDVKILDENTIIGSATLPDWIMGGDLTSRLWVRIEPETGTIMFRRPLYNDDLQTSDRKFDMKREKDDQTKFDMVLNEIERLRYISKLASPFADLDKQASEVGSADGSGEVCLRKPLTAREIQHRRNRRRYHGL